VREPELEDAVLHAVVVLLVVGDGALEQWLQLQSDLLHVGRMSTLGIAR
jgi:hypothetical protein